MRFKITTGVYGGVTRESWCLLSSFPVLFSCDGDIVFSRYYNLARDMAYALPFFYFSLVGKILLLRYQRYRGSLPFSAS